MEAHQRILVVCEDPGMLDHIGKHLCEQRFDVRCESNAPEALTQYQGWPADLVVCDYRLGGTSGLQLAERLRQINPLARFILLIPPGETPDVMRATQSRVMAYLGKPFRAEDLMHYVRQALNPGDTQGNRREYNRYPFNVETHCVLINPFDDSEGRPVPALMRDVSRSGVTMIVRQMLPVPVMLKVIFNLPRQQHAIIMLAKTASCTLTQIPGVYRLGARFIGLLPREMEKAIALTAHTGMGDKAEDIFMGKSFKMAMREWLATHHETLPTQLTGLTQTAIATLAAEFASTAKGDDETVTLDAVMDPDGATNGTVLRPGTMTAGDY